MFYLVGKCSELISPPQDTRQARQDSTLSEALRLCRDTLPEISFDPKDVYDQGPGEAVVQHEDLVKKVMINCRTKDGRVTAIETDRIEQGSGQPRERGK